MQSYLCYNDHDRLWSPGCGRKIHCCKLFNKQLGALLTAAGFQNVVVTRNGDVTFDYTVPPSTVVNTLALRCDGRIVPRDLLVQPSIPKFVCVRLGWTIDRTYESLAFNAELDPEQVADFVKKRFSDKLPALCTQR